MSKRGLIVYNPAARGVPPLARLHEALSNVPGWELTLATTEASGHATELARDAAHRGVDAVIACGGDGTVNEVANGLAYTPTALAVLRGGTANVWAKEVRLPRDSRRALRLLEDGEVRTIDLGRAGDRFFLLLATFGFDAAVVRSVPGGWKRRLGATAYVLQGLRCALSYRARPVELTDGAAAYRGDLYWAVLGNTRSYAGVVAITHQALVDDGQLDLYLLRRGGAFRLAWLFPTVLIRRHHRRRDVLYRRIETLEVRTPGLPVQVDGEYLGETPMRFEVVPGALRVIVPRGLRSPLFGRS